MGAIGRIVAVLPVSLVASVLVREPQRALSELELKSAAHAPHARTGSRRRASHIPRQDQDYAFGVGLRMLTLRHMVTEERAVPGGAGATGDARLLCQCHCPPGWQPGRGSGV